MRRSLAGRPAATRPAPTGARPSGPVRPPATHHPGRGPLDAATVLALQRDAGNAAVAEVVAQRKASALRQGAEGQDVRELQSALNHVDEVRAPLAVVGIFGPLTDKAVREFQS